MNCINVVCCIQVLYNIQKLFTILTNEFLVILICLGNSVLGNIRDVDVLPTGRQSQAHNIDYLDAGQQERPESVMSELRPKTGPGDNTVNFTLR